MFEMSKELAKKISPSRKDDHVHFHCRQSFIPLTEPQCYQVHNKIIDSARIKAGYCPFSSSQILLNYRWFSSPPPHLHPHPPPLSPDSSFSNSTLTIFAPPNTFGGGRLFLASIAICHAWNLLMELTTGRIMEQPDGDPFNPSWICICLK